MLLPSIKYQIAITDPPVVHPSQQTKKVSKGEAKQNDIYAYEAGRGGPRVYLCIRYLFATASVVMSGPQGSWSLSPRPIDNQFPVNLFPAHCAGVGRKCRLARRFAISSPADQIYQRSEGVAMGLEKSYYPLAAIVE